MKQLTAIKHFALLAIFLLSIPSKAIAMRHDIAAEQYLVPQVEELKARIKTRGRTLVKHVEPIWPKAALENKTQGSVTMSFTVNTNGSVSDITIIEATPKGTFDNASKLALSQWQYAKLAKVQTNILTKFDFSH